MTSALDERRSDELGDPEAHEDLADRYGGASRGGRPTRATIIGGALIALLTFLVVGYWGLAQVQSGDEGSISTNVVSFRDLDEGIAEVDINLTAKPGLEVACAIEVQNSQHLIVGWDVVVFPAAQEHTRHLTVQLRTTQPLDLVLVNQCWIP